MLTTNRLADEFCRFLGPDEGRGMLLPFADVAHDVADQCAHRGIHSVHRDHKRPHKSEHPDPLTRADRGGLANRGWREAQGTKTGTIMFAPCAVNVAVDPSGPFATKVKLASSATPV